MNRPRFDPLAELCAAHPGMTPEAALDLRVDGLRDELAALGVNLGPPLDLEAGLAALGIGVLDVYEDGLDCDGALLEPEPGAFHILLNRAAGGPARRRFTLAHELVHTLLPDDPSRPRHRTVQRRAEREDAAIERLVDRGAARLLMPPAVFAADLAAAGMTPRGLLSLAERYRVSREAVAVNAVQHWPAPAAVAFLRYAHRPSTRNPTLLSERPKWRVERAFHGEGFPVYLHRGFAFSEDGVVGRAARAECQVAGKEILAVGNGQGVRCLLAAWPLGRAGIEVPGVMVTVVAD